MDEWVLCGTWLLAVDMQEAVQVMLVCVLSCRANQLEEGH